MAIKSESSNGALFGERNLGSADRDWSDEEIEHIISTIFSCLLIFILSYLILIRPWWSHKLEQQQQQQRQQQREQHPQHTGEPQHEFVSTPAASRLIDGVQSYAYMLRSRKQRTASAATTTTTSNMESIAHFKVGKQLMQTLASVSQMPSISVKRGSIVVVTVKSSDIRNEKQQLTRNNSNNSALFLNYLGLITNLFVCISFEDATTGKQEDLLQELETLKDTLYRMGLDTYTVPPHRIVAASSSVGRIAFVRQIRPEFFIDYDVDIKEQLQRFGFHVILYGVEKNPSNQDDVITSYRTLGDFLPSCSDESIRAPPQDTT